MTHVAVETQRQTARARRLLCVVASLLIVVTVLAGAVAYTSLALAKSKKNSTKTNSTVSEKPTHCLSQPCILTAGEMLKIMNTSVDPCDDFYEYACGKWDDATLFPSDGNGFSVFKKIHYQLSAKLKVVLESPADEDEPKTLTKAKTLYRSCMNVSTINDHGDDPLLDLIKSLGGWPVIVDSWSSDSCDLEELMANVNEIGYSILWECAVVADFSKSDNYIIQFSQADLALPRDYFIDKKYESNLLKYETFAIKIANRLGGQSASVDMKAVIQFESKLANISHAKGQPSLYYRLDVSELATPVSLQNDSTTNWIRYLVMLFDVPEVTIDGSTVVDFYDLTFFNDLQELLKTTDKRTVANYIIWRVIHDVMKHKLTGGSPAAHIAEQYVKEMPGYTAPSLRSTNCVSSVTQVFGMVVGRLFVDKYFDKTAKHMAVDMINGLREAFTSMLAEVTWLDESTRKSAIEKANAITERIGYPDYILDDDFLDKKYKTLDPQEDAYFENIFQGKRLLAREKLMLLNQHVNKSIWSSSPATVNAFYIVTQNQIVFPAGIFQPPVFDEHYPKSVNFGGIGVVIGHEITHGFDDNGRGYDAKGESREWWSEAVKTNYNERAQCLVEQYGNYTVPEIQMNVNGKLTLGENIADNGGLKESFLAYRNWVSRQDREEDVLPVLNLNNNQLFFLSFAQLWCGTVKDADARELLQTDEHTPGRFRVIGTLSNSKDFARAYNCTVGTRMNPAKKCEVW